MSQAKSSPKAADFMSRRVRVVTPEMPMADVIQFLLKHEISNAPVVEKTPAGNVLIGFISERDCLDVLASESFFGCPSPPQTAQTIMRTHPVCVSPDTELYTLASIFRSHGFRHLPVTDKGMLVGIVSRRDILRAMDRFYQESTDERKRSRFPPNLREIINQRFIVSSS